MQLLGRLEIKSKERIIDFLNSEMTGRIASIDKHGYPQIIPMNFVFVNDAVYMHSHTKGEKLDNIQRNYQVGFEVDRHLEFLPSYFTDPNDASQADTLYISVVIKGDGVLVQDRNEKSFALNALMEKYQPEGGYTKIQPGMQVVDEVAIIKVVPKTMRGKYKIGQHLDKTSRLELARLILERNSPTATQTVNIMGIKKDENGKLSIKEEKEW